LNTTFACREGESEHSWADCLKRSTANPERVAGDWAQIPFIKYLTADNNNHQTEKRCADRADPAHCAHAGLDRERI